MFQIRVVRIIFLKMRLTCSEVHIPADDGADSVGGHAAIDGGVDVLAVQFWREGLDEERSVGEEAAQPRKVRDHGSVQGEPGHDRWRRPGGGAVQPPSGAVGELRLARGLHQELRPSVFPVAVSRQHSMPEQHCKNSQRLLHRPSCSRKILNIKATIYKYMKFQKILK